MKKRNILYISLAVIVLVGLVWAFVAGRIITKNFKKDIITNATDKQEVVVHGLIVTETKNNEKYWEIYADEGQYNNQDKVVVLNKIFGNFYRDGEVIMSFKADKGTLTEETKKIVLYQNALVVYKGGEYITADRLTWQGKEDNITAYGNILMEKKDQIRLRGTEATLTPDWSDFKMHGKVKTELFGGEGKKI